MGLRLHYGSFYSSIGIIVLALNHVWYPMSLFARMGPGCCEELWNCVPGISCMRICQSSKIICGWIKSYHTEMTIKPNQLIMYMCRSIRSMAWFKYGISPKIWIISTVNRLKHKNLCIGVRQRDAHHIYMIVRIGLHKNNTLKNNV